MIQRVFVVFVCWKEKKTHTQRCHVAMLKSSLQGETHPHGLMWLALALALGALQADCARQRRRQPRQGVAEKKKHNTR